MESSVSQGASSFSVRLSGKVNFMNVDELKKIISQFVSASAQNIEFDFGDVDMIDSSGLGQLVTAFDAAEAKGGKIIIKNAKGIVLSTLKTTKFDDLATLE